MTPAPERRMIVVAVDAFKGTLDSPAACAAIASGWRSVSPHDKVHTLPQADGGEGTAKIVYAALGSPGLRPHEVVVSGPNGQPVTACWWALDANHAVADLASASGIELIGALDPMGASTFGFGQLISAILAAGYRDLTLAVGGSASTDGGAGALIALGLIMTDHDGAPLFADGGASLARLGHLDASALPTKVTCRVLTDVSAPLLGPHGAAAKFGPQKGANAEQIAVLEAGLVRWARAWDAVRPGRPANTAGMGAAGGTAFGLARGLGGELVPGAAFVSAATGLPALAKHADVLITGEGKFDATSLLGKVSGHALGLPGARRRCVVAGELATTVAGVELVSLSGLAQGLSAAKADPQRWLFVAGAELARGSTSPGS